MPTYTVHAPPPRKGEASSAPERFAFVRDGFHFWAFLFGPFWLLARRLWLALAIYVAGYVLIEVALIVARAPPNLRWWIGLPIALLTGFEASSIRRWTLARRQWRTLGFVVGEDAEMAERRFYAEWAKRPEASMQPPPSLSAPVRRGPPSPHDVIGLFPEPGGPR